MNSPHISVIVAVFRGARTLERMLASLEGQRYQDFELIVIDGGSDDGTVEIIRSHASHISYWISEPDGGLYDAWNKGLAQARGEWICFLGADDYLLSADVFERMAPLLDSTIQPGGLVYGSIALVNRNGDVVGTVGEPWEKAKRKLADAMPAPHPGLMHHRSWFEKYGTFDTSFRIAGDYEMLLRGALREPVAFIPDLLTVAMEQGGISSSPANSYLQLRELRIAQKRWGFRMPGWRFVLASLRVFVRTALNALLGQRLTYRLLDIGRMILGKKPYWTKL